MKIPIRITPLRPYISSKGRAAARTSNPENLIHIDVRNKASTRNTMGRELHITYLNVCSLKNKTTSLYDYIVHSQIDMMVFTETWLHSDEKENTVCKNDLIPDGFTLKHVPPLRWSGWWGCRYST